MTGHTAKWLYQSLRKLPDAYRGIQPIFFDCDKHFTGPVRTGKIENKKISGEFTVSSFSPHLSADVWQERPHQCPR